MGLAASQARWISLAARKSNVEYEGQQINQARTALANQSAELWNQLFNMAVPCPPSTTEFTKTQYIFNIGDSEQMISDIHEAHYTDSDGISYNSYVKYYSEIEEYTGIRNTNSNPQVQYVTPSTGNGYYLIGTKPINCLDSVDRTDANNSSLWASYSTQLDQITHDWPNSQVGQDWTNYKASGDVNYLRNIYFWDNNGQVSFTSRVSGANDSLEACRNNANLALHTYYADYQKQNKEVSKYGIVEYDSTGRATKLQLEGSSMVYNLETTSVTDDSAYNDALNKYYYEQQMYEKKVQDINAKTEQIQTEDRTLELRLKALDTEQSALQTEMEAVKKVISKNVDTTFKTFES